MRSISHWRARHLLGAWVVYWVALAVVALWTPITLGWRLSRLPDGHGSASFGVGDGAVTARMVEDGVTRWSGTMPFTTLVLWLTVPPLLLWLVWVARRPAPSVRHEPVSTPELPPPNVPEHEVSARETTRERVRLTITSVIVHRTVDRPRRQFPRRSTRRV